MAELTICPLTNTPQDSSNLITYLLRSNNPKIAKPSNTRISTHDLYKQGLIYKSLIAKRSLKQKGELEKERLKECTFHPKITFYKPIRKIRIKKKDKDRNKDKDKDRDGDRDKEMICSTEPSINQTTKKPFKEIEIFANHLYQYHTKYKMHIDSLSKTFEQSVCPFTPKINHPRRTTNAIKDPFYQRMTDWAFKQQEKKKTLSKREFCDTKTGKPFFNPILISSEDKKPWSNAASKRGDCSNLFKSYETRQNAFKKKQEESNRKFVHLSNFIFTNQRSSLIVNELYVKLYKRIFDKISNGSLTISKSNLDTENLAKDILDFINPLIDELLTTDETLNEKEFIRACEYLVKRLSVSEKNKLIQSKII